MAEGMNKRKFSNWR